MFKILDNPSEENKVKILTEVLHLYYTFKDGGSNHLSTKMSIGHFPG